LVIQAIIGVDLVIAYGKGLPLTLW
jgi:hypothetical protein